MVYFITKLRHISSSTAHCKTLFTLPYDTSIYSEFATKRYLKASFLIRISFNFDLLLLSSAIVNTCKPTQLKICMYAHYVCVCVHVFIAIYSKQCRTFALFYKYNGMTPLYTFLPWYLIKHKCYFILSGKFRQDATCLSMVFMHIEIPHSLVLFWSNMIRI